MIDIRICSWSECGVVLDVRNRSGICRKCRVGPAQAQVKREWRRSDPRRNLLQGAADRARGRGLPFDLTIEDIFIPHRCPILDIDITPGDGKPHAGSPSLDRINPLLGYIRGNVRVISHKAKACKNSLGDDELFQFCRATLLEKGFTVTQIIDRIDCPRCYSEGPHERVACALDGSDRTVLCGRCHLEWRLNG